MRHADSETSSDGAHPATDVGSSDRRVRCRIPATQPGCVRLILLTSFTFAFAGCGGGEGDDVTGPPSSPSVASVELVPPVAATVVGGSLALEATPRSSSGLPLRSVPIEWASSDENVATVDDGTVTGEDLGEAQITARAEEASTTITVVVIEEDFGSVSASGVHSCGLMADGSAYCWGGNANGMLGDGTTYEAVPWPVPVAGGLTFTNLFSGSGATTCGVTDDGVARCWGNNNNRELGNGSKTVETCDGSSCSTLPFAVDSEERFRWAGSLYKHSCAIKEDGTAYCWGFNPGEQTGTGSNGPQIQIRPEPVITEVRFDVVDGGFNHSCGLSGEGTIYCWGSAAFGVKGDDAETGSSLASIAEGTSFADVASGGWHACGVTTDGAVYCWGRNNHGQLGAEGDDSCRDGTENCSYEPVRVESDQTFASVTAGFFHTCALTTAGQAYCWGDDNVAGGSGKLGDPSVGSGSMSPVAVAGGHSFVSIDAGRFHTCGVVTDGAAYCWGWGGSSQLGAGETEDSAVPVNVFGSR